MSSLKIEDFYDLRFLANLNNANGRVFFEMYQPVEKTNKYESEIFELRGSRAVRYTRGTSDRNIVIDATGFNMAYLASEEKKATVFVKNIETGEERKLWETELNVKKMQWDRLSKGLYIIVQEKPKEEDFKTIEHYPIYFNGEGFFPYVNYKLLHLRLSGRVRTILEGNDEIIDIAVNPSSNELAIIERPEDWDVYDSRIGILDPDTSSIDFVNGLRGNVSNPVYDQNGGLYLQYLRQEKSIFESPKIYHYKENELVDLSEEYDISPENTVNSDSRMGSSRPMIVHDGYLYFIATVSGRAGIYRIDSKKKLEKIVAGDFSVDCFDFSGDRILYVSQSSNTPQEIFSFEGKITKVTDINSRVARKPLKKAKKVRFKASDGRMVEGWILRGNKRATVLEIHGGPRTAYGEAFSFEFHLLNSRGFTVIYSNPRGSDSYGNGFALEIRGKYGERDYEDVLEFLDYSSKANGLRTKKVGVIGGSYGGFMVNWIIGHTNRFDAAITDRSISDQVSFYFSSDIGPRFNSDQIGGTPYDNIEHFWDKSPLKFARNVKTPLLIIHSEEDYRCPVWQAYELFTQLKRQGSEVRMVSFKGENHDLSRGGKPKNRMKRLEEILRWFENKLL